MLDHLIDFEPEVVAHSGRPTPLEREHPADRIDAQVKTADWLKSLGAADTDTVVSNAEVQAARASFTNLVSSAPAEITHKHLSQVKTPAAVQHLVGMLTAYDWEFIQQAKEIRGYTVAKLLEECENPSANIRLKALTALGRVTEVGLFTDKIEVKKTDLTDEEIDRKLKDKLAKFMGVQDADVIEDIEEVSTNQQPADETERPDTESN
jgi:hypothetical protein